MRKTLDRLSLDIIEFNQARGWIQNPQDLAKSIVIEAAELLEHFQWDATHKNVDRSLQGKDVLAIKKEVADVFWYLIGFCHDANIDLKEAIAIKYAHNAKKYPIEMFNGKDNLEFYNHQHLAYRRLKK